MTTYTLVIPTYDRPELLARLLHYLERANAEFPVVVLDSSHEAARAQNEARIARSSLAIRTTVFPAGIDPYLKIRDGLRGVTTPYCSICADDDVVLLPALRACVALLDREPAVAAAHGLYFNFVDSKFFDLSSIVYRGPSVTADDPLYRLRQLFARYETVSYAVSRTDVIQRAFEPVDQVDTALGREILTAALTAVSGHLVRIGDFYYGRNTGGPLPSVDGHPSKIIATSPEMPFREYPSVRRILLEAMSMPDRAGGRDTSVILDLIFLRYLKSFLAPPMLSRMVADHGQSLAPEPSADHVSNVSVRRRPRLRECLNRRGLVRLVPTRIAGRAVPRDYILSADAVGGRRTYRIFYEFVFPEKTEPAAVSRGTLLGILDRLHAY